MKYFLAACLFATVFIGVVENAMLIIQAEKGKEAKIDFEEGMFFIKRITKASPNPQPGPLPCLHPKQDGSWTTDGTDKIPSTAFLHWNGTMTFKKIEDSDAGDYSVPLESSQLPMAQSLITLDVFFMQKSPEKKFGGTN